MFEARHEEFDPRIPNRYLRIGSYIICIDLVHGVMYTKTESKEFPYQVYVTYTDKSSVILEMPSLEQAEKSLDRIGEYLQAK